MTPFAHATERPYAPSRNVVDDDEEEEAMAAAPPHAITVTIPNQEISTAALRSAEMVLLCSSCAMPYVEIVLDHARSDVASKMRSNAPDFRITRGSESVDIFISSANGTPACTPVAVVVFKESISMTHQSAFLARHLMETIHDTGNNPTSLRYVVAFLTALDTLSFDGPRLRSIQTLAFERLRKSDLACCPMPEPLERAHKIDGFVAAMFSECQHYEIPAIAYTSMRESRLGRENLHVFQESILSFRRILQNVNVDVSNLFHPYLREFSESMVQDKQQTSSCSKLDAVNSKKTQQTQISKTSKMDFVKQLRSMKVKEDDDYLMFM